MSGTRARTTRSGAPLLAAALALLCGAPAWAAAGAPTADIGAGQRVFARCASCHQIGGTAGAAFGPQLTGIVGRPAASTRDFAYSPAMKGSRIVWTEAQLAAFIRDPKQVVPGTSMRFWGLSDERQIANLIAYLRSVK
ncbi:c-type cytochrome [Massilia sp. DWR3-1-1]|uniref:c-type cytochrome n=1 Tax=Massilia sp. DWR3-1-1 TaxID=2804559 RepID=UPI003CF97D3A